MGGMPRSPRRFVLLFLPLLASPPLLAQHEIGKDSGQAPQFTAPASHEAKDQLASFELPPGFVCDLVAAEPDLCNAVAFAIDHKGRFYVAETFRLKDGAPDTRDFMAWKDDDLACRTVADRVAKYEKHLGARTDRYAAYSERVRMLVDTDKNGTLDRSTIFAEGFADLADGIASGVLPVGDDVWFTNIPKLWKLRDSDADGVADQRTVVHDGFGVHTSLIGHDLHGLIVGPDRRLYFSIGDRGFHVQQGDRTFAYPDEGAVLRCELDGSDLEVVHRGFRNPQELAFDAFGDLFTGDNNSDAGDKARLVQIVPGGDSGWRIGYQWLTDRGTWCRERLWEPRHPGQPAWILPPIANFAEGPSGLVYDPGIGLPERFRGCFLLCDFRGSAAYSGVHALRLERDGAGHALASSEKLIWRILATDVDIGPDGSIYLLDWVLGWNKTGKGRVYRLRGENAANDLQLRQTAQLLASGLNGREPAALLTLLSHPDRRVRQQAQFALVDLDARDVLAKAAADPVSRQARLHAIQGLGIVGRRDANASAPLLPLLDDGDADVRAIACRCLGDARLSTAIAPLQKCLADGNPRVQREAALALARFGERASKATAALFTMLRQNDDHDPVLRHAAVFALAAAATSGDLLAAAADPSPAVRLGVLLALARRSDAEVARFLVDPLSSLRREAARAIHDQPIPAAMPALARHCYDDEPGDEHFDWRAISACRQLGEVEVGEALVHLATLKNHPAATRQEALAVLAEWRAPHGQCRVTGLWRPTTHPNADTVAQNFRGSLDVLLADPITATAAAKAAGDLGLRDAAGLLLPVLSQADMPVEAKIAALNALAALSATELASALAGIGADAPVKLRQRAVALLSKTDPAKAVPILASLLANGTTGEQRAAFEALGDLKHPAAAAELAAAFERWQQGTLAAELHLDLLEAAKQHEDQALRSLLERRDAALAQVGELGPWLPCRDGGDAQRGREVFFDHEPTQCTRCHALGKKGSNSGPPLDAIGKKLSRDQLLAALITPSASIAEGYGTTTIETHDGSVYVGIITRDQDGEVMLMPPAGEAVAIPNTRIRSRRASTGSAMPPMGGPLDKRQLRDLIEFLAKQQKDG
jgi:quinoprotein glucose dehydrogenase